MQTVQGILSGYVARGLARASVQDLTQNGTRLLRRARAQRELLKCPQQMRLITLQHGELFRGAFRNRQHLTARNPGPQKTANALFAPGGLANLKQLGEMVEMQNCLELHYLPA